MEAMLHDLEAAVDLLETMADDHPAAAALPSAALSSQLKPPPPPPPRTKTVKMVRMEEGVSRSATKHRVSHLLANLGWVDLNFECCPVCPIVPGLTGIGRTG